MFMEKSAFLLKAAFYGGGLNMGEGISALGGGFGGGGAGAAMGNATPRDIAKARLKVKEDLWARQSTPQGRAKLADSRRRQAQRMRDAGYVRGKTTLNPTTGVRGSSWVRATPERPHYSPSTVGRPVPGSGAITRVPAAGGAAAGGAAAGGAAKQGLGSRLGAFARTPLGKKLLIGGGIAAALGGGYAMGSGRRHAS